MDNNQNQNSQLDQKQLFFKQMFLLPSDTDTTERGDRHVNSARKLKVRSNLLFIYALVVTLLLLLSANNSLANNNRVAAEPDDSRLALLELKLEQSQMRMLSLESKLAAAVDRAIAAEVPQIEVTAVETNTPQVKVEPKAAINQLPILPVPVPPPPSFFHSSSAPLPIPQPAEPPSSSSALIPLPPVQLETKPQLSTESVTSDDAELKSDAKSQWLGQTNTVYFSSTFEQNQQSQHIADKPVGNSEQTQENSVAAALSEVSAKSDSNLESEQSSKRVEVINLDLLAKLEPEANLAAKSESLLTDEELSTHLSSTPLKGDRILLEKLGTATVADVEFSQTETATPKAIANQAELAVKKEETKLIAKLEDNSATESSSLFSDEDLARYLSSAPLLDDNLLREKLGTISTVAQSKPHDAVEQVGSESLSVNKTEVINFDLLAKLDNSTPELQQELFSDEDLARYLSSTPLLDDEVISRRLNTPATASQLALRDTNDSVGDKAAIEEDSQPSPSTKRTDVINLSLLSKIEAESHLNQKAPTADEDLMQYMTLVP